MSYRIFRPFILAVLLLFAGAKGWAQSGAAAKGNLFIIGGGLRSAELVQTLIKTAGLKEKDYIIVLPMSSGEPEASFKSISKQLSAASANSIGCLNFDASTVNNKQWLDSLKRAKLVFITGGDQNRFMKVVLHTPVYKAIHQAYQNGATVAGTSAGAAVMSKYMITGEQLLGDTTYHATFDKLWGGNVEFEEGMGLVETVIIDQHFMKRSRYNRLLSALNAHPDFDCIGIDEDTAIIIHGKTVKVAGTSQVLRIADPVNIKTDKNHLIKMDGLKFSIYTPGDKFKLK